MTNFKTKQQKQSKRVKTQPLGYSAFDDSIVLLVVSKIHKCLHDISRSKFAHITTLVAQINKDMNVITSECKNRDKLNLLINHLVVFELIHNKKYDQALEIIRKKQSHFNEKTHKILKLSVQLIQALLLKHLGRQEQSKSIIKQAIDQNNLNQIKIQSKSTNEKIIESTILCISITADYFGHFQNQPNELREIYREAYRISHKYLTQYHQLTQTLFSICKKFPNQTDNNIRKSKKKYLLSVKKRNSATLDSNRSFLKDSKSDRSYLNFTIQPKLVDSDSVIIDLGSEISKLEPKRLKTLQPCIDLKQQKQKCLKKLYGTQNRSGSSWQHKLFKRQKLSTQLKGLSYEPQDAVEMKQLQKISKIYLPKLEAKRKYIQSKKREKLNAIEVLKFGSTLSKLKPNYFDKIKTQQDQKLKDKQKKSVGSAILPTIESNIKQNDKLNMTKNINLQLFQSNVIQKDVKDKLIVSLKEQPQKQDSCQLI